jgi:hypothetical protein
MLDIATICWAVWKARNKVYFEKTFMNNPFDIIFSSCAFMQYWIEFYLEETHKLTEDGVDLMMKTAIKLMREKERNMKGLRLKEKTNSL